MSPLIHGNKIAYYRFKKGLSLRELSNVSGVDSVTINRLERGISRPRAKTAKALCDALDVPISELFSINSGFQPQEGA